jgi:hypothetical protein
MKKPIKIILGVATLWPILYMIISFVFAFSQVFLFSQEEVPSSSGLPIDFRVFFGLHMLTIFWIFILLIIYIVNLFRNDRVAKDMKALWAVVLFMGNMIAMPIYWYLYIWREPKETIEGTSPNTA